MLGHLCSALVCSQVAHGPIRKHNSETETNMEQTIRLKLNSRGILQWWGEKGWINNYIITKQSDIWFMVSMNEFLKGMSPFPRWGVKRNQLVKSTSSKESTLWCINNWPSGLRYCGGTQIDTQVFLPHQETVRCFHDFNLSILDFIRQFITMNFHFSSDFVFFSHTLVLEVCVYY